MAYQDTFFFLIVMYLLIQGGWYLKKDYAVFMLAFALVFVVSIGWEIFELSIGAINAPLQQYIFNTWSDLTMDMIGAGTALLYFMKSRHL